MDENGGFLPEFVRKDCGFNKETQGDLNKNTTKHGDSGDSDT